MTVRRQRRWGLGRRAVVTLTIPVVVLAAMYFADKLVFNRWSTSLSGEPTLTGYWQAEADFGQNDHRKLVMDLRYRFSSGKSRHPRNLEASLRMCGPRGTSALELTGHASRVFGNSVDLDVNRDPGGERPDLYRLTGEWAGERITAQSHQPTTTGSTSYPTVALQLRRVTRAEFESACRPR